MSNMPPDIQYSNQDLLRLLIKDRDVHEGHWILSVSFSFAAVNIGQSPDGKDAGPAGVVGLTGIGIAQTPDPLPFSMDAADVNPLQAKKPRRRTTGPE